ncbi:MAG: hypothetical protein KTR24_17560 [Saprospiraceae bacterium]|nr:hypothetical protein [Saprospiraceae bacterium]
MNRLLVGTRKGLIVFHKTAEGWSFEADHFLGVPVALVYCDPTTSYWWVALDHGHWGFKLHRSLDLGSSWEELPAPRYPEGSMINAKEPAVLKYIWSLQSTSRGDGSLWIGTVPGGLFLWREHHAALNQSLWEHPSRSQWFGGGMDHPGIHSIVVDPTCPDVVYVGISCGGVYKTTDGGRTWSVKNKGLRADFLPNPAAEVGHDPHLLLACDADRSVMWQQNHCGIFRSTDAGEQWDDVSALKGPANFGFAIAVDHADPQRAWVAPGISDVVRVPVDRKLCICRTTDGGRNWQTLDRGLPSLSYDIVYRHALISHQEEVIFGTTTGNLYASHNGGDRWTSVSNSLAMVYALALSPQ